MKILITGGAGLIGSNFAKWVNENTDDEVVVIDNLSGGYQENVPDGVDCILGDVRDSKHLNHVFTVVKPDVCYHFAAYAAEGRSNYIRTFNHFNNTIGTSNVINACVNHGCKLVFTSSVAVYSGAPPFTEEMLPNPIDSYGVSKYCSEMDIRIAGEMQGLDWCIIRPRNVYGEYQNLWDTARNVFGIWMYQILHNQPMTIFGDGSNKRAFTYIGDILEPLYRAKDVSKEVINLGSPTAYTIKEANEWLQKVTGYDNIIHLEARHEVKDAWCEVAKSQELLGYNKETRLVDGLARMWHWAQQQPERPLQAPPGLEVFKTNHSSIK
jgi:UDP-glucose 4-epimerase